MGHLSTEGARDCGDELRAGLRKRQKSSILRERVPENMTQDQTFRVGHTEAWGLSLSVSRARDYGGPFFMEIEALVSGELTPSSPTRSLLVLILKYWHYVIS